MIYSVADFGIIYRSFNPDYSYASSFVKNVDTKSIQSYYFEKFSKIIFTNWFYQHLYFQKP